MYKINIILIFTPSANIYMVFMTKVNEYQNETNN